MELKTLFYILTLSFFITFILCSFLMYKTNKEISRLKERKCHEKTEGK